MGNAEKASRNLTNKKKITVLTKEGRIAKL
jgi:hypothetical protein